MSNTKSKLIAATTLLVVGIVAVVTASVAWFTISTAPEVTGIQVGINTDLTLLISKTEDGEYGQMIDITEDLQYFVPLKPVSTVDGENWFIATYDEETGVLNDIQEFTLDDDLSNANVWAYTNESLVEAGILEEVTDPDTGETSYVLDDFDWEDIDTSVLEELDGDALSEAEEQGYYIYTEFWLMTEEDNVTVTLSIPSTTDLEDWEVDQGAYGTYALDTYFKSEDPDDDGAYVIDSWSQTAIRAGFLIEGDDEDEDEDNDTRFVIYEPNADSRSYEAGNAIYDTSTQENYIVGYDKEEAVSGIVSNYQDGYYIETQPIALAEDGETYELQSIDPSNLIVQLTSAWQDPMETITVTDENDEASLDFSPAALLFQAAVVAGTENSNHVATFGQFVTSTSLLYSSTNEVAVSSEGDSSDENTVTKIDSNIPTSIASNTVIVELEKDIPQKVTLFIWIEGQDVDCWNDIAFGNIKLNFELAGTTVYSSETE